MKNILDIKSFINFLSRNKAYTAIDMFGLSVSLMFVILITVYTAQELSTDKYHEKYKQIYVLGNDSYIGTALPIPYRLQERYPEIEKVCPIVGDCSKQMPVMYGDKSFRSDILCVDSTFFDFFSFKLLMGNPEQALKAPNNTVISETFAQKVFGAEDPIGKSIRLDDTTSVIVTGVMADIRHSAIQYSDMLVRLPMLRIYNAGINPKSTGNAGSVIAFLMVSPGVDLTTKSEDMKLFFKDFFWPYQQNVCKEVTLTPFKNLYFSPLPTGGHSLDQGDERFIMVLMSVGILILLFAVFNYINLTVAQAGQRAKEMATRRLLGSSRFELFLRLMTESTLLTFISFLLGLFLAVAALPYVNNLLNTHINLMDVCTPAWIGGAIGLILLISFLSGLLPALLISSSKPIDVVRGMLRRRTKMVFSKGFITFQNTITIIMLAASITMVLQVNHLIHAPLGYNKTDIIDINNCFRSPSEKVAVIERLKHLPSVKSIGFSYGTPTNGGNNLTGEYEGKSISMQQFVMDSTAFKILGLEIIQDNQVVSSERWQWYLSELALKEMNLPQDAKVFHLYNDAATLLGIIKDVHLREITSKSSPFMLKFEDLSKPEVMTPNILIDVQGDAFAAYNEVKDVFEDVTKLDFTGKFLDQQIQETYESQVRLAKIVSLFAFIAILISLLGLLAMSTYFIHQRMQEIAIRKVFGSDNQTILKRLVSSFLIYVGIAFVIATPISWYFMKDWLADYSYRIELSPMIFISAGLFCLLISFLAVFLQSWQAANINPVENVKSN